MLETNSNGCASVRGNDLWDFGTSGVQYSDSWGLLFNPGAAVGPLAARPLAARPLGNAMFDRMERGDLV